MKIYPDDDEKESHFHKTWHDWLAMSAAASGIRIHVNLPGERKIFINKYLCSVGSMPPQEERQTRVMLFSPYWSRPADKDADAMEMDGPPKDTKGRSNPHHMKT